MSLLFYLAFSLVDDALGEAAGSGGLRQKSVIVGAFYSSS